MKVIMAFELISAFLWRCLLCIDVVLESMWPSQGKASSCLFYHVVLLGEFAVQRDTFIIVWQIKWKLSRPSHGFEPNIGEKPSREVRRQATKNKTTTKTIAFKNFKPTLGGNTVAGYLTLWKYIILTFPSTQFENFTLLQTTTLHKFFVSVEGGSFGM